MLFIYTIVYFLEYQQILCTFCKNQFLRFLLEFFLSIQLLILGLLTIQLKPFISELFSIVHLLIASCIHLRQKKGNTSQKPSNVDFFKPKEKNKV